MTNDIVLRPYQRSFIDELRNQILGGQRRICGVAPCGAGKTIMMGWMIKEAVSRGNRCVFFVHRKELLDQTADTFRQLGINFGVIAANITPHYDAPVQIASVQTLVNRLDKIPQPDLLICDEAHHILADSYMHIVNHWQNSVLIGVTATPERTGGIRLGNVFSAMVLAPSVSELIEMGNLASFNYFAPVSPVDLELELKSVRVKYGEYVNSELEAVMSNSKIIGSIVDNYIRYANGTPAICYCVNVNHSKFVANKFNAAGISAAHVDGETPKLIRNSIVDDFRCGKFNVLCNAELFGEGFDVPNVGAVILARPTQSLTLYLQQSMRCMRPDPANPSKVAVIIDHVNNYQKFGLPNAPRNWSLESNVEKAGVPPQKECPMCHAVMPLLTRFCPACGFEFHSFSSRDSVPSESNGTIAQIYSSDSDSASHLDFISQIYHGFCRTAESSNYKPYWAVCRTVEKARSYADCLKIAELSGYKEGWAYYQWQNLLATRKKPAVARATQ